MKITNFEKKKKQFINKGRIYTDMQKSVIFVKNNVKTNLTLSSNFTKDIVKLEVIAFIQGNIELLHIAYVI